MLSSPQWSVLLDIKRYIMLTLATTPDTLPQLKWFTFYSPVEHMRGGDDIETKQKCLNDNTAK